MFIRKNYKPIIMTGLGILVLRRLVPFIFQAIEHPIQILSK